MTPLAEPSTGERPAGAEGRRLGFPWSLALVVLAGALVRLGYAIFAEGLFHPDEIFQSLEPAHGVVYGTGVRSWEFVMGARPWTTPGVYVLLLGALKAVGVTSPARYLLVCRLCNAAVAATWPWFCFRIGRALRSRRAGLLSAALCALWYFLVLLAPRALNHTFSVTGSLWALARVLEERAPSRRSSLVTGALFGLAFAFRYQDGLVALGGLLFLLSERRGREVPMLLVGAALVGLGVGGLDAVTWGLPFQSLFAYLQANLLEGAAARFGGMPAWFYLWYVPAAFGLGSLFLLLVPWSGARALKLLALLAGTAILFHSLTDNKQIRFVLPSLLVAMCAVGCGADALASRFSGGRARLGGMLVILVAGLWTLASLHTAATLTFADLGVFQGQPEARESPWFFRRDLDRALMRVGGQPDLCGVVVYPYGGSAGAARLVTTGGYAALHRPVPLTMGPLGPEASSFTNYGVLCPNRRGEVVALPGFGVWDRVGTCVVARRSEFRCDDSAAQASMADRRW